MWRFGFFDAVETAPGVYDRVYNAEEFSVPFSALIDTGVLEGAGDSLEVTTDGSSMQTTIGTGVAFIRGRYAENTSPRAHTHDTETVGVDRIDRIVIRLDLRPEARHVESFVKKGVASSNPVPPALQRDENVYEISLAQVRIRGGQTFISPSDIIDERGDEDICPWARSKVLPHIDAGDVAQLRDEFDAFKEEVGPIVQIENETVTVGTSGDFSTINEALEYLSKRHARFWPNGYTAEIRLLPGFVMQEQVFVEGVDLGWITITAEDNEVIIDRNGITSPVNVDTADSTIAAPAFCALNNATLPVISALFKMNEANAGSALKDYWVGIAVINNSRAIITQGAGVTHVGSDNYGVTNRPYGLLVANTSLVEATGANFSFCNTGIGCFNGSTVVINHAIISECNVMGIEARRSTLIARHANITDTGFDNVHLRDSAYVDLSHASISGGNQGIFAESYCFINARNIVISDFNAHGISATHGCYVNAMNANITNGDSPVVARFASIVNLSDAVCQAIPGQDSPEDLTISGGAIVYAGGMQGGYVQTPNTLTRDGIIFD